jgi:hypothetical protein
MSDAEVDLRVITGKVRLSFPYLFTPRPGKDGGEAKYSVMLLIPKSDTKTITALRKAEAKAIEIGKTTKFGGSAKGLSPSILKDADEDGSAEDYPEREGHMYMTCNAGTAFNEIMDQSEVYSGVYARVSVTAFAYKYEDMKKGVSFGLNNIQILGGGESLAGGKRADQDFDVVDDDEDATSLI